jgi:hypothetical protein
VDRWAYFLKTFPGPPALRSAQLWRWSNWQNVGNGLILSTKRTRLDTDYTVTFPVVSVLSETDIPAAVFTDVNVSLPISSPMGE